MSSRSPSPFCGGDVDERMSRLSLGRHRYIRSHRRRRRRRLLDPTAAPVPTPSPATAAPVPTPSPAAFMPTPSPPVHLFSTSEPSYASVVLRGFPTVSEPQLKQELGSDSDFELDSPRLTTPPPADPESDTPTSPHTPTSRRGGSPPLIDIEPAMLPTCGYSAEEWQSPNDLEDPHIKSWMDSFVAAAEDVCQFILPEDTIDEKACSQRQSNTFAVSALKHYNDDDNNKVKYELINAIRSGGMIDRKGCYGHVNFTAKANQKNSKEELFFAELRLDQEIFVPTCMLSLEGEKTVGGLCGSKYDSICGNGFRIDPQHCYSCGRGLKHPKNGALYECGHVADSDYYLG